MPTPFRRSPLGSRTVVEQERKRAKIGTLVVFGLVAIAGCSTAVTSGTGADGAGAAEPASVVNADQRRRRHQR